MAPIVNKKTMPISMLVGGNEVRYGSVAEGKGRSGNEQCSCFFLLHASSIVHVAFQSIHKAIYACRMVPAMHIIRGNTS